MQRLTPLKLERLESRDVPAILSNPWPNANQLPFSFAADNSLIAGFSQDVLGYDQPSQLIQKMSSVGTTSQWQTEILRAFQTWAVNTNINIALTPDAGNAFGTSGSSTSSGAAGQIRVGAGWATPEVIAINQGYNLLGGAWSGTMIYNTAKNYSIGTQVGKYDLYSVSLNEAGNIFGLADRDDPTSALDGHYLGTRTGLNASDIVAIQTLYGTRSPDTFGSNDTLATATRLYAFTAPTDITKQMVSATRGDLTTLTDVDHFVFTTKADTTSLTVRLETVGISLLNAKISIYDNLNVLVGTATSAGPTAMQDLVVTLTGVKANKDYKVRIEKATNDVFGIGAYNLKVGYNFNPIIPPGTVLVHYTSDGGTNNTIDSATILTATSGSANNKYLQNAVIDSLFDVDYYRFTSPASTPMPITITVTPGQTAGVNTRVTVYDSNMVAISSNVLVNGSDGRVVLQVANPLPAKNYFVKVESLGIPAQTLMGNYTLSVDFTRPAVALSTLTTDTLTFGHTAEYLTVTVPEARMYHLALGATSTDSSVVSGVRLIVYDLSGQIAATMTAEAGRTNTGVILLGAGSYYFKFEASTRTGVPLTNLTYKLRVAVLSDPIDPVPPEDPLNPLPPPPDYETHDQGDPFYIGLPLPNPFPPIWTP